MAINSEGIYGTRPWKTFGEGPAATAPPSTGGPRFNESGRELTAEEVRFTTKNDIIYAFVMGWPERPAFVRLLATTSNFSPPKIQNVELLGFNGKLEWTQDEQGLAVKLPREKPCDYAIASKIT